MGHYYCFIGVVLLLLTEYFPHAIGSAGFSGRGIKLEITSRKFRLTLNFPIDTDLQKMKKPTNHTICRLLFWDKSRIVGVGPVSFDPKRSISPFDFNFERCFSMALLEIPRVTLISEAVILGLFLICSIICNDGSAKLLKNG
jgi:hypothetical protein